MAGRVTAVRVVEHTGKCWKVEVTAHPLDWTGLYESHDDGATWTTNGLWLVNRQLLDGLRAVIRDHRPARKLWVVYNGFQRGGSCAVIVEADSADEAIVLGADAFRADDVKDLDWWSSTRMTAEPFELGKVVDLA